MLRLKNFVIGHRDPESIRLAHRPQGFLPITGQVHANAVGDGVGLYRLNFTAGLQCPHHGGRAGGLHRHQLRQFMRPAQLQQIVKAFVDPADDAAIAHRYENLVRRLPLQLLGNLQRHGLLALGQHRIAAGIAAVPSQLPGNGFHQLEGLIVAAVYRAEHSAALHDRHQFAGRSTSGHQDHRPAAVMGRQGRQRCGGVAGGGGYHGSLAIFGGMLQGYFGGPVLQRTRGLASLILDIQRAQIEFAGQHR